MYSLINNKKKLYCSLILIAIISTFLSTELLSPKNTSQDSPVIEALSGRYNGVSIEMQKVKKLIFVAGQVGEDLQTGQSMEKDVTSATKQTIANLETILKSAGSSLDYVVRVDVFLKDFKDWDEMNAEYSKHFSNSAPPARQTVAVGMDNVVEMSCIAIVPLSD